MRVIITYSSQLNSDKLRGQLTFVVVVVVFEVQHETYLCSREVWENRRGSLPSTGELI